MFLKQYMCYIRTWCSILWIPYCVMIFLPLKWMPPFIHVELLISDSYNRQVIDTDWQFSQHILAIRKQGEQSLKYSKRPLVISLSHTHKDKAEALMVQQASFTLHLLWSTDKTQSMVCVTQCGPLSIPSTASTSQLPFSLSLSTSLSPILVSPTLQKSTSV